jgi:hypothetical protein
VTALSPQPEAAAKKIRRWRKIFLGIYIAFTSSAIVLTFLSILVYHWGGRPFPVHGPQISFHGNNPEELRSCLNDLNRLLSDLHKETFTVQARALRFDTDPETEWRNWSADWKLRWQSLRWRCRLEQQSDESTTPIIKRMAKIHLDLEELQFSYGGVVDKFVNRYIERLRNMRSELSSIHALIDREKHPVNITHPNTPTTGAKPSAGNAPPGSTSAEEHGPPPGSPSLGERR